MENEKEIIRNKAPVDRRKRVKRLKIIIVTIVLLLLILPSVCCMILFLKVNQLEKQMNLLTQLHSSQYELDSQEEKMLANGNIVYAAEKDKTKNSNTDKTDINKTDINTNDDNQPSNTAESENNDQEVTDQKNTDQELPDIQKQVYLTFDDGPSEYTDDILDVLKQYNIKATFFVIGKTDDESIKMYKRIVEEGHTLGMHSYSHKYDIIYGSIENFEKDLKKLSDFLYDTTGERPKYYRFPGGSSNTVSKLPMTRFISVLNKNKITYYDWNVENGDATGTKYTTKQLVSNIMNGIEKHTNSYVLMHDTITKETTVKSLPVLIKKIQKKGYNILPIDENSLPIQHIKSEDVVK